MGQQLIEARSITSDQQDETVSSGTDGEGRKKALPALVSATLSLALLAGCFMPQERGGSLAAQQSNDSSNDTEADWSVFLPDGEGRTEVILGCSSCHDLRLVITQMKTNAGWKASVQKMISTYQAAIDKEDIPIIVAYLSAVFGENNPIEQLPMNINRSSVESLARLPGISTEAASEIVKRRKAAGPYTSVEDLSLVKGIDAVLLKRIRAYVTVMD